MKIQSVSILRSLFREVVVPSAVFEEFSRYAKLPDFIRTSELTQGQKARADALKEMLSPGEREAIILAIDLGDLLVIDERTGRRICEERSVKKTGTYALIRQAYEDCFISRRDLEEKVRRLKTDLFYENWIIEHVLAAKKPEER